MSTYLKNKSSFNQLKKQSKKKAIPSEIAFFVEFKFLKH